MIKEAIVAALMWIGQNTGYHDATTVTLPNVTLMTQEQFNQAYPNADALYLPSTMMLVVPDAFDAAELTIEQQSTVVHELVHHQQVIHNKFGHIECGALRESKQEAEAYNIQIRFLDQHKSAVSAKFYNEVVLMASMMSSGSKRPLPACQKKVALIS